MTERLEEIKHYDLQRVGEALKHFRPRRRWWRRWVKRSSVALILREADAELQVLMIKRADRDGDPWSGHMAFPGGRMDPGDNTGVRTAQRETLEELSIDLEKVGHCIGRLSDLVSRPHSGRRPMVVSPYVFRIHGPVSPVPNHEVAEAVWVPISFIADHGNRVTVTRTRGRFSLDLPCYYLGKKEIWGMSLAMLDELLGVAAIPLKLP
ncbi:MAG: NUDIX hydrolase [Spongiibacter sp.]|uniref:NUDIX hydrolase n=1 Tax=Spongiibacter thalassae TaxID=2721624 RepID=UPI0031F494A6